MSEIKKFYKENTVLCTLTFISIIIILLHQVTMDLPELWNHANEHFELLSQLSLAIVANFIFSIFQIYIPNKKKREQMQPYIKKRFKKIAEYMNDQFLCLSKTYLKKETTLLDMTDDDFRVIIENIRLVDSSDIQVAFELRYLTIIEMIAYKLKCIDEIIYELENVYQNYLYDDCDVLLKDIRNSHYKLVFEKSQILSLFDTKGMHGDGTLPIFKQYKELLERINSID